MILEFIHVVAYVTLLSWEQKQRTIYFSLVPALSKLQAHGEQMETCQKA